MAVALALHLLAAVVWVGGMFFAYLVLRPAAAALEPPVRIALWREVLGRFFRWVWGAVLVLPLTGYWMVAALGGLAHARWPVHAMQAVGWLMIALFLWLQARPWPALRAAAAAGDWPAAGAALARVRAVVALNLALGLALAAIGALGRYL
ncbi:CopD family protein [Inmirania thermothiophila]|uniref:Putative membrane protein n=1 Tax=Inmirania thermothiophila TaxID=1750597 RepID=A0A3N1XSB9_9GAMM|nr:CopD family protein [Inmirania thermothiophila]ROR29534.1 putative membrane protein [Inmirania thermothiophila]